MTTKLSEQWWLEHPNATRCHAKSRRSGNQCKHLAMKGGVVCRTHGGAAPQVKAKAAERLIMAADDAVSRLLQWMRDDSIPIQERRKIAESVLDRAGLGGAKVAEIGVTHKFEQTFASATEIVIVDDDDIEDAVIVSEPPAPDPYADSDIPRSPRADLVTFGDQMAEAVPFPPVNPTAAEMRRRLKAQARQ
ncbi:hypothetical protein [Branchiibius sp. NY16-3462-2]|uniref:hypothetical protein n=1 Tax=Branchiibius sp. NY16-3462-2 TaxID=1807500 RepID=UPI00079681C6|nr:hypothetical protein [Branchiibius sp. NY16-3462-2]KYH43246.1 hypothetical protein AZH51_12895 [Branchiibius sp. NY16-3462-2]